MYDGCALLSSLGRELCRLNIMHARDIIILKAITGSHGGYCMACNVGFHNDRSHRCTKKCSRCYLSSWESLDIEMIKCDSCVRVFFGCPCFERQAQRSYNQSLASVCESIKICKGRGRLVNSKSRHNYDVVCKTCRSLQSNHLYYMQPLCRKVSIENSGEGTVASREKNPQTNTNDVEDTVECVKKDRVAFIFYDFETRQDARRNGERKNSRSNSLRNKFAKCAWE